VHFLGLEACIFFVNNAQKEQHKFNTIHFFAIMDVYVTITLGLLKKSVVHAGK